MRLEYLYILLTSDRSYGASLENSLLSAALIPLTF